MRKKSIFIAILFLLFTTIAMAGCTNTVKYDLTFIVDNEVYSSISTTGNEVIQMPQNPTKDYYTFGGWFWDENEWQRPFTINSMLNEPLSSDMSIYAKWNPKEYSITYDLDGGTLQSNANTFTCEQLPFTLPTPTRDGYVFEGWKDQANNQDIVQITSSDIRNYSIKAVWTSKTIVNSVIFENTSYVYDGTEKTLVATNLPNGVSVQYTNNRLTNAGSINATAMFYYKGEHIGSKTATLTIQKATYDMSSISFTNATYIYDGIEKEITIEGMLPQGVSVSYLNNKQTNAGTKTATAIFTADTINHNVIPNMTATLTIEKATYDMSNVIFTGATYTYDGTEKTLTISGALPQGVSVNYSNNEKINAGEYQVVAVFTGNANYNEIPNMTATLIIQKATYEEIVFNGFNHTYNGQVPTVAIQNTLPNEITVSYSGEITKNVGTYNITAIFNVGTNYNTIQPKTIQVNIMPAEITFRADNISSVYGENIKSLTYTTIGTNYDANFAPTLTKQNGTNVGTYTITITATNSNYNITLENGIYTIEKATYNMSGISFNNASYVYDGTEKELQITGILPDGVIVYYENNTLTEVGSIQATAIFAINDSDNYNAIPNKNAMLVITKATYNMSNVYFNNATYTYDGNEKQLTITGTLPQGVSVQYTTNKLTSVGSIEVTASFIGDSKNYYAIPSKNATLTIEKATYDMSNISFADTTYTYDGNERKIEISGTLPDGVSVSYSNNKRTNAGISNAIARFTGDSENYNEIPNMTAKLTINKAVYDISNITFESVSYVYDGTEKKIEITGTLPDGVSVQYTNNKRTNAGTSSAIASFVYDTENYETLQNKTATLTITKATYDMSSISFDDDSFVYDGNAKSIYITGTLPQGVNVTYSGNEKINVGEYEVIATFTGDSTNYKSISNKVAVLTIEKATPVITPYYVGDITTNTTIQLHYNENIAGTLTFDDNQTLLIGVNNYNWTFVPQDTNNYNTKTGQISIVVKAIVNFYNENTLHYSVLVEKDDYISAPQIPTKADYQGYSYTFSHWSLEDNGTEFDFDTQIENNTNLYAVYTSSEIGYSITYHNTKEAINSNVTVFYVTTQTFTIQNISIDGYIFDGWFDSQNYSNQITQIKKGTYKNIDLYAKWTPIQYTITYHSEYDVANVNPNIYTIENQIVLSNLDNIKHYNFAGWYEDDGFTTPIDTINIGTIGNKDLYAKWEYDEFVYIRTYIDLLQVNYDLNDNYKLMNDIDLNNATWSPIGMTNQYNYNSFNGCFDGNNFTISNFTITQTDYAGLFASLSKTSIIRNLKLENISTQNASNYIGAIAAKSEGYIVNCCLLSQNFGGSGFACGMVAQMSDGTIENCYSICNSDNTKMRYIGGIVGRMTNGNILNCYSVMSITVNDPRTTRTNTDIWYSCAGGIVGYIENGNISNCYATGNVSISVECRYDDTCAGGIVGRMINTNVSNCYATGNVSVLNYDLDSNGYAGGFVGYSEKSNVSNCYATGNVSCTTKRSRSTAYAGGFVGRLSGFSNISSCYATGNVTAVSNTVQNSQAYARGFVAYEGGDMLSNTYQYSQQVVSQNSSLVTSASRVNISSMEAIWVFIYSDWDSSIWNLSFTENPTLKI